MQKRVFIIHGWEGDPFTGWLPWIASELTSRGMRALVPPMPTPAEPNMKLWTRYLDEIVEHCDEHTYFVGHSLGCQAILRYLQNQLPAVKVGGVVFVAGFEELDAPHDSEEYRVLHEWIEEPIHWEAIRGRSEQFVAIFSDNDPEVPLRNVRIFDEKLEAQTLLLHNREHFSPSITPVLPEALDALLAMMEI